MIIYPSSAVYFFVHCCHDKAVAHSKRAVGHKMWLFHLDSRCLNEGNINYPASSAWSSHSEYLFPRFVHRRKGTRQAGILTILPPSLLRLRRKRNWNKRKRKQHRGEHQTCQLFGKRQLQKRMQPSMICYLQVWLERKSSMDGCVHRDQWQSFRIELLHS